MSTGSASVPRQLLVDGVTCDADWPMDRGLMYGDGLFETLLVRNGCIRFEAQHVARLAEGCARLQFNADLPSVWTSVRQMAAQHGEATLRLQLTRGVAQARGYTPCGTEQVRVMLAAFAPPAPGEVPPHRTATRLRQVLGENPALAGLKHCNRLEQVLGRMALRGTGAFEGVMGSSSGLLISGTMSNVFLELDGELVTPSTQHCGVAGVVRAVVLQRSRDWGHPVREAAPRIEDLARCTALAFSNARMGLVPVHAIDGRPLDADGALQALAARVNA